MKKYEGMFLFDPAQTTDWEQVKAELDRIMQRADAKVLQCGKWDERRLAYEINGRKRAVYALVYFEADPTRVGGIERDTQLSEAILRCLIIRADHVSEEQMTESLGPRRHHLDSMGDRDRGPGDDEGGERGPSRRPVGAAAAERDDAGV